MRIWSGVLVVAGLALAGCGGGDEDLELDESPIEALPADTGSYTEEGSLEPGSPNSQRITVVNSFDDAFVLTAVYQGETKELGTVLPRVDGEFFIQAPAGTPVELRAREVEGTRSMSAEFTLGDPITWRLADGSSP